MVKLTIDDTGPAEKVVKATLKQLRDATLRIDLACWVDTILRDWEGDSVQEK